MKKKIFLGLLPLLALTLTACGGGEQSQSSEQSSEPESSETSSSQGSSQQSSESSSQQQSSEPGPGPQSSSEPGPGPQSSEPGPGPQSSEDESSEEESSEEESSEERDPSGYIIVYDGEDINLYQDEEYDGSDVWGGITKYVSNPFDVTEGASIAVKTPDGESLYANGFNKSNNVVGEDPDSYTIRQTAEGVELTLYGYDDGFAFNLTGYDSGDDPVVPTEGFYLVVDGEYTQLEGGDPWDMDPTFNQFYALGVELEEGNVISFYDADNDASWGTMAIDPASAGNFTQGATGIEVGEAGAFDVYIKMKMGEDNIYFGPAGGSDPVDPGDDPVDPSAPTEGFYLVVDGEYTQLEGGDPWDMDPTFNQFYALGVELEEGNVISFYDADNAASWGTMAIDPASAGNFTQGATGIEVGEGGVFDLYIKMKMGQDNIYFGNHSAE